MPGKVVELKDYPLMMLSKEEEEEESLPMIGKEWIKIGDEYFRIPVVISPSEHQAIKEVTIDSDELFQFEQNMMLKRKFEAENQEEAGYLNNYSVPDSPTEVPKNALIKNHSHNLEEKYVKLHVINRRFLSKTEEVEEEEEEEAALASPYSFRTKRRYLYSDKGFR